MLDIVDIAAIGERFVVQGEVVALSELRKGNAGPGIASFTRPMGGWLATYGKIAPNGVIVPTKDRDGQVFEAARQLGAIDWQPYLKGGKWNDTHNKLEAPKSHAYAETIVGLPLTIEFHDGTTELSKAHGKVGFWTTGRLFDRADPASWEGLGRRPTEHEFARSDYFWSTAHLLKGLPRPLGLSAEGLCALSPCKKRIIAAQFTDAAVCEVPVDPDCTVEMLEKGRTDLMDLLIDGRRAPPVAGGAPCGKCRCPAGACEGLLRKGQAAVVPQDLEGAAPTLAGPTMPNPNVQTDRELLIDRIMGKFMVDRETAERWLALYLANKRPAATEASQHRGA